MSIYLLTVLFYT